LNVPLADQSILQPYIVVRHLQAIAPDEQEVIVDIGTGSGYTAAIAAEIVESLMSVNRIESLNHFAKSNLEDADINYVRLRLRNGNLLDKK